MTVTEDPVEDGLDTSAAKAALLSRADWVVWAGELIPETIDLASEDVRQGFFAENGSVRGLIWDLLDQVARRKNNDFTDRAFRFVLRCVESDDPKLYNPAGIGFLCKVAQPGHPMSLNELAHRLPNGLAARMRPLFTQHYELEGFLVLNERRSS